jgi:hypothetical protein
MSNLYRYLDTVGNGSGTKNHIAATYAATQGIAKIAPEPGSVFKIHRMIVSLEDTSGMIAGGYGDIGSPLSEGITVKVGNRDGVKLDLTDGVPIKTNSGWGRLCYDVDIKSWGTTPTNELLVVRWTFSKSGAPIVLNGRKGEYLYVTFDDDLDELISHYFLVQGTIV